jgi:hypothetical protein
MKENTPQEDYPGMTAGWDDSEISDWDVTLQDGLDDFPWDNEE